MSTLKSAALKVEYLLECSYMDKWCQSNHSAKVGLMTSICFVLAEYNLQSYFTKNKK